MSKNLPTLPKNTGRRVVAAGFLGTTIEFYDFFIYGTAAALVFPKVFFPDLSSTASVMASFSTFGVAFFARPLGGIIFGHIGDRKGRKTTLVATMVLMGVATVLIGCIPSASSIGIWAPVLLVLLRLVQGLAVGGEWASAALFVGEYAPKNKRALYALSPTLGTSAGLLLSTLTFLAAGVTMSAESFESWGWRVPFLLSAILVAIGFFVRVGISETPVFKAAADKADKSLKSKIPVVELFKHQGREVLLAAGAPLMWLCFFYVGAVYMTNYGTSHLGLSKNTMLTINIVAVGFNVAGAVIGALLADRIGRRAVMAGSATVAVVWAFLMFPLVNTADVLLVGGVVAFTLFIVGFATGTTNALLPEIFRTEYRSSGAGVSFNLASVIGGAIPPIIAAPILAAVGSIGLSVMLALLALVSVVAVLLLPETKGTSMHSTESVCEDEAKIPLAKQIP